MNGDVSVARVHSLFIALGVSSLASLGIALYLQFFHHQAPCPLCILQRYVYVLVALCSFAGLFTRRPRVRGAAAIGILASAAGGVAMAGRQLWLLKHPTLNCGFDALQPIVDRLPLAYVLPAAFKVAGFCETPYPPIFGLSLPAWSLVVLLSICATTAFALWRGIVQVRRRLKNRWE